MIMLPLLLLMLFDARHNAHPLLLLFFLGGGMRVLWSVEGVVITYII